MLQCVLQWTKNAREKKKRTKSTERHQTKNSTANWKEQICFPLRPMFAYCEQKKEKKRAPEFQESCEHANHGFTCKKYTATTKPFQNENFNTSWIQPTPNTKHHAVVERKKREYAKWWVKALNKKMKKKNPQRIENRNETKFSFFVCVNILTNFPVQFNFVSSFRSTKLASHSPSSTSKQKNHKI